MPRGGFRVGSGKLKGDGWRARQMKKRLIFKKELSPKRCGCCGEIFTNERHKYCSLECCLSANHEKLTSFPHVCLNCGEEFKGQKKQKYCSDECNRRKNQRISVDGTPEKRCTACGEWKQASEEYYFYDRSRFDGFYPNCKPCNTKHSVARGKTEHGKRLRKENRIKNIETERKYRKKMQSVYNDLAKIRARTDLKYNLNNRMRCLMWQGLKKNKGGHKWQDLVGYSIDDLRRHLEKQFKDGMSWERFLAGEIHVDHKIPRSAFNFSHPEHIDFKKCWALKNLQPLWAKENMSKGSRLYKHFQPSLAIGG